MIDIKCETCGCETDITAHHLIPKHVCRSNKYSKNLKTDDGNIIMICRVCHDFLHATWTDQQLRDLYSTKEKLMSAPEFIDFLKWRKKHLKFNGHSKMSNQKRR